MVRSGQSGGERTEPDNNDKEITMRMVNTDEHAAAHQVVTQVQNDGGEYHGPVKAFGTLVRNIRRRSRMRAMYGLDDDLLRDVGIEREDLDWALSAPWYSNPGERLGAARAERLRAARAGYPGRSCTRPTSNSGENL